MKLGLLVAVAGVVVTPALMMAQHSGPSTRAVTPRSFVAASNGNTEYIAVPDIQPCPAGLEAKQSGMTDLVKVRSGDAQAEPPQKPGQRIHISIRDLTGKTVAGATVTARGLSARARFDDASSSNGASDIRRTLNITFTAESDHSLSSEVVLPGFTAVKSIKLEAIEYADGSTHDFSGQRLCTVAPDPIMLIGNR